MRTDCLKHFNALASASETVFGKLSKKAFDDEKAEKAFLSGGLEAGLKTAGCTLAEDTDWEGKPEERKCTTRIRIFDKEGREIAHAISEDRIDAVKQAVFAKLMEEQRAKDEAEAAAKEAAAQ